MIVLLASPLSSSCHSEFTTPEIPTSTFPFRYKKEHLQDFLTKEWTFKATDRHLAEAKSPSSFFQLIRFSQFFVVGSYALFLTSENKVSFKDVDLRFYVRNIAFEICNLEFFFKSNHIDYVVKKEEKIVEKRKDESSITFKVHITSELFPEGIDLDIILVEVLKRESLADSIGLQIEFPFSDELVVKPHVLKGNTFTPDEKEIQRVLENNHNTILTIDPSGGYNHRMVGKLLELLSQWKIKNTEWISFTWIGNEKDKAVGAAIFCASYWNEYKKNATPLEAICFLFNSYYCFSKERDSHLNLKELKAEQKTFFRILRSMIKNFPSNAAFFPGFPPLNDSKDFSSWEFLLSDLSLKAIQKPSPQGYSLVFQDERKGGSFGISLEGSEKRVWVFVPRSEHLQEELLDTSKPLSPFFLKSYTQKKFEPVKEKFFFYLILWRLEEISEQSLKEECLSLLKTWVENSPVSLNENNGALAPFFALLEEKEKRLTLFRAFTQESLLFKLAIQTFGRFWIPYLQSNNGHVHDFLKCFFRKGVKESLRKEIACSLFPTLLAKGASKSVFKPYLEDLITHEVPLSKIQKQALHDFEEELEIEEKNFKETGAYEELRTKYKDTLNLQILLGKFPSLNAQEKKEYLPLLCEFLLKEKNKGKYTAVFLQENLKKFWRTYPEEAVQAFAALYDSSFLKDDGAEIKKMAEVNQRLLPTLFSSSFEESHKKIKEKIELVKQEIAKALGNHFLLETVREKVLLVLLKGRFFKEALVYLNKNLNIDAKAILSSLQEKELGSLIQEETGLRCVTLLLNRLRQEEKAPYLATLPSYLKKTPINSPQQAISFLNGVENFLAAFELEEEQEEQALWQEIGEVVGSFLRRRKGKEELNPEEVGLLEAFFSKKRVLKYGPRYAESLFLLLPFPFKKIFIFLPAIKGIRENLRKNCQNLKEKGEEQEAFKQAKSSSLFGLELCREILEKAPHVEEDNKALQKKIEELELVKKEFQAIFLISSPQRKLEFFQAYPDRIEIEHLLENPRWQGVQENKTTLFACVEFSLENDISLLYSKVFQFLVALENKDFSEDEKEKLCEWLKHIFILDFYPAGKWTSLFNIYIDFFELVLREKGKKETPFYLNTVIEILNFFSQSCKIHFFHEFLLKVIQYPLLSIPLTKELYREMITQHYNEKAEEGFTELARRIEAHQGPKTLVFDQMDIERAYREVSYGDFETSIVRYASQLYKENKIDHFNNLLDSFVAQKQRVIRENFNKGFCSIFFKTIFDIVKNKPITYELAVILSPLFRDKNIVKEGIEQPEYVKYARIVFSQLESSEKEGFSCSLEIYENCIETFFANKRYTPVRTQPDRTNLLRKKKDFEIISSFIFFINSTRNNIFLFQKGNNPQSIFVFSLLKYANDLHSTSEERVELLREASFVLSYIDTKRVLEIAKQEKIEDFWQLFEMYMLPFMKGGVSPVLFNCFIQTLLKEEELLSICFKQAFEKKPERIEVFCEAVLQAMRPFIHFDSVRISGVYLIKLIDKIRGLVVLSEKNKNKYPQFISLLKAIHFYEFLGESSIENALSSFNLLQREFFLISEMHDTIYKRTNPDAREILNVLMLDLHAIKEEKKSADSFPFCFTRFHEIVFLARGYFCSQINAYKAIWQGTSSSLGFDVHAKSFFEKGRSTPLSLEITKENPLHSSFTSCSMHIDLFHFWVTGFLLDVQGLDFSDTTENQKETLEHLLFDLTIIYNQTLSFLKREQLKEHTDFFVEILKRLMSLHIEIWKVLAVIPESAKKEAWIETWKEGMLEKSVPEGFFLGLLPWISVQPKTSVFALEEKEKKDRLYSSLGFSFEMFKELQGDSVSHFNVHF